MSVFLLFLIISEVLLPNLTCASRARRQTTKVRISAIGDTIILRFLQPHMDTKLEGYILGYGSSLFSKQFIQLPEDGEPYETEIDAEPKYLVAVQPVNRGEVRKQCTGKETLEKPLHLVIGTVSPTSVMLSWGTLLNTLSTETNLDDCIEDGHYTVRYREKEPKKTWNFQTCPTTDTIIDQLKPDTPYEFGVRAESENINGAWSPPVIHNTAVKNIDIHKPLQPEIILSSKNPEFTESNQAFSPSVPIHSVTQSSPDSLLSHTAPHPTQRITHAKDTATHKPPKSGNLLMPKKPITEGPQTFSPTVPILHSATQRRPASILRHTAPSPIPRVTQDIHKQLKPEIFMTPEKPTTEGPLALSPSVPILHSVTQSISTSVLRHTAPPVKQRVTQVSHKNPDIHKRLKTEKRLRPKKPIAKSPQAFFPSVPILNNMTQRSPASLLRHTAPPPIPRVTLGTGSDGMRTSRPSEDSLFLNQTLISTHTPMSNLKTTAILQTHHSTTTQQPFYTTQPQLTTNKTLFNIHKTQTNTIKTVANTVKAQLNITQKKRTQLHNTIHPQPESSTTKFQFSTSTIQFRTTQFQQHTVKHPLRAAQPKPRPPQPYTIHPQTSVNQFQHSTVKGQLRTTQKMFTTLKPITTQSQSYATQPQSITTQSQPYITHPIPTSTQSSPQTTQSKPSVTVSPPHKTQPQSIGAQSQHHTTQFQTDIVKYYPTKSQPKSNTIRTQPHRTRPQSTTTQTQHHATQVQPITTTFQRTTTQSQNSTAKQHPGTTQIQPTTTRSQPHKIQPQPIKAQSKPKTMQPKLPTTKSKTRKKPQKPRAPQPTFRSLQQPVTNKHYKNTIKPKFTHEPNTYYQVSTALEGLSTTEFQQRPDHHPTSATIKQSKTNTWQNGKTEHTLMNKPKQLVQMPSEKSNTQKKPVNKKLPVSKMAPSQSLDGHLTKPVLVNGATNRNQGQDRSSPSVARTLAPTVIKRVSVPLQSLLPPTYSNTSDKRPKASHDEKHKGQLWDKPYKKPRTKPVSNEIKKKPKQVDKYEDKVIDLKVVDPLPILKPSVPPTTSEIYQKTTPTTTPFFAFNGSWYNMGDNSSVFSSVPVSDLDPMGRKRFVAPHVIYQIDKPPDQPCSITHSLSFFPEEDNGVTNITGPPKTPPTNLTVVTVEGCPSFVILDWEKTDNETTEYEVISSVKSPNGHIVSVVKTNQTHTAVENLKAESSYKFTVTGKNELGSGPSSETVSFSTESADPRVSEIPTGKNAIWSSFSFKADSYTECTGAQYVKRTWYRKFVGIQLCNSLRYKIYLSDSLKGKFYNIGDETGYGEDHCQFVDSFLDGRTGVLLSPHQLPLKQGYFRAVRQEPVKFGKIGGSTHINYVSWYECGVPIPGSW